MNATDLSTRIADSGIVGIVRGSSADTIVDIVDALARGGVDVVEITADTDDVTRLLRDVSDSFGDEVLLGAGTVLDSETARAVLSNGAAFVVTPTVNPDVIELANRYGAPSFPGAYTPTEVVRAYEAGADAVKLFPASTGGVDHLQAVSGPLGHVPLVPTGGVSVENAEAYFDAGATALGVGSSLVDPAAVADGEFERIAENAEAFREIADARDADNR